MYTLPMTTAPIPAAVLVTAPTPSAFAREAVRRYRAENPRSRAPRAIVTSRNTAASKSMRNVLTGAEGPTWCARWPKTQRAIAWEIEQFESMFGVEASCR